MSEPFIGEIRVFAGNFAPLGWLQCDGSLQSIANYEPLYSLLGTMYGGDGISTFGLPDLRGRITVHMGAGFNQGQKGGAENVTLITSQLPSHTHAANGNVGGTSTSSPAGALWGVASQAQYSDQSPNVAMNPAAVGLFGGSQSHENRMPYLTINYIIATEGIYPTQG